MMSRRFYVINFQLDFVSNLNITEGVHNLIMILSNIKNTFYYNIIWRISSYCSVW